ncbi:MAG: NAD(P)H-hydrate dehydratase [Eubacteriales bacterium]|nr:NAD(P)H-hydrate dehydratase [Eubacteriales bacterium]
MSFLETAEERALSPEEQAAIDSAWVRDTGLDSLILMETAANALYREILARPLLKRIVILLGFGNNSGDGWALARLLANSQFSLELVEIYPEKPLSRDCQAMREAALKLGLKSQSLADFLVAESERQKLGLDYQACLFVDAIFGSGFKISRPLGPEFKPLRDLLLKAREAGAELLAVDSPSGLDSTSGLADPLSLKADCTVSFLAPKRALLTDAGSPYAGEIAVADLGMPRAWYLACLEDFKSEYKSYYSSPRLAAELLPRAEPNIHKGSSKKLMITAGAPGLAGAALLAARAALAAGSAYTYLQAADEHLAEALESYPELLLKPLNPGNLTEWEEALAEIPVHLIGPGVGTSLTREFLLRAIQQAEDLLLDADALNLIAREPELKKALAARQNRQSSRSKSGAKLRPAVLTPHPGEFKRLFPDLAERWPWLAAAQAAEELKSIIVYKSHRTIVALPDRRIIFNQSGNKALAKAGSGDSLAGILAAFLARGLEPAEAAVLAVYCHGRAADLAALEEHWLGLRIPLLITDYLDPVFRELEEISKS